MTSKKKPIPQSGAVQQFTIVPAPGHKGVNLTGESLSYPLWYASSAEAAKYARWISRTDGCRIETRDERGALLLVEDIPPGTGFA